MSRKSLSKTLRFEVFKRDSFRCQYCGAEAPGVVLHVDHIHPVAEGGGNDILNLITACADCNGGKGARLLSDDSVVNKQRAQLEELQERRDQMDMMLRWRDGLRQIDDDAIEAVKDYFFHATEGWVLSSDEAVKAVRALVKKHALLDIFDAIDVATERYIETGDNGKATPGSVKLAWSKVSGILRINSLPEDHKRLYYIKGILRNRLNYVPQSALRDMEAALERGVTVDDIEAEAKLTRSWSRFMAWLER